MKKTRFFKYAVSMIVVAVLVAGAVYFPKIYNYKRDSKDFNRVNTYEQDEIELYEYSDKDTDVGDRLRQLGDILNNNAGVYYVMQSEEDADMEKIIGRIIEELGIMAELGLIPDLSEYELEKNYSIQCKVIESDSLEEDFKYWNVEFSDFKGNYVFNFLVDYETYMIYYANLAADEINELVISSYYEDKAENIFSDIGTACMEYYIPEEIRSNQIFYDAYYRYTSFELVYGKNTLLFTNIERMNRNGCALSVGLFELNILNETTESAVITWVDENLDGN